MGHFMEKEALRLSFLWFGGCCDPQSFLLWNLVPCVIVLGGGEPFKS